MPIEPHDCPSAAQWIEILGRSPGELRRPLAKIYGPNAEVTAGRLPLLRGVLQAFLDRYGDRPVRLFRSPGRINLRGMHVDTHGGWLNLMTHQREVVVAASLRQDARIELANTDSLYPPVSIDLAEERALEAFNLPWRDYIASPQTTEAVKTNQGHWGNYVRGAVLSAQHRSGSHLLQGFDGIAGSDLPAGAALSSSHALCTALMHATLGMNGRSLAPANLIRAVQDAEWYTGARSGLADQGAMILGAPDTLVNVVLHSDEPDLGTMTPYTFPDELRVLVAHSHTQRSLSGAQAVDYTRNRFAYSMALDIAQQEARSLGWPEDLVRQTDHLAAFAPDRLEPAGGIRALYALLRRIPEACSLGELRERYELPSLDRAYEQYFASVSEEQRPRTIRLRGPLIYGIAESERARQFPFLLKEGAYAAAGTLMSTGHDGDRVCFDNATRPPSYSDAELDKLAEEEVDVATLPGEYGASSPVLDALVDAAKEGGALGACLTGAGIAGSVLALCHVEQADGVVEGLRACLETNRYAELAGWTQLLSKDEAYVSVVVNSATAAAGEVVMLA